MNKECIECGSELGKDVEPSEEDDEFCVGCAQLWGSDEETGDFEVERLDDSMDLEGVGDDGED